MPRTQLQQEKIVGILGGMGPEATLDFMSRILHNTPAQDDCDHIRCIVDNNPKVPSRIKALVEGGGENPGPVLADMAGKLETWGADFLVIPCNTAHVYYEEVQKAVRIPVLSMISLAVDAALQAVPGAQRVGLLASPAVRAARLYEIPLQAKGITTVYPDPVMEQTLLSVIKRIKGGETGREVKNALAQVVENLRSKGTDVCIAACTELGIILEKYDIPVTDAAEALAKAVVREAKKSV